MDQDKETSKLAIIGNVDAGKSTLVGVLTKGILDDAGGGAREVFNSNHFFYREYLITSMRNRMVEHPVSLMKSWALTRITSKYYQRDLMQTKTNIGLTL